ncbi:MAG: hypothetical protein PHC28_11715 [Flavobacterium sp.]|uniref:hypothetical protein n=1 Tax=Flavobacterium sp. TaxID=239 RepID=UPI0026351AB7|nr:hypothetical protein [Flavobacterium sp.]MDD5151120.1 hypothetical protein [Flavobacterium sp.]
MSNICIEKHLNKFGLFPIDIPDISKGICEIYSATEQHLIYYIRMGLPCVIRGSAMTIADWFYIREICKLEGISYIFDEYPGTYYVPNIIIYLNNYGKMIWDNDSKNLPDNHIIVYSLKLNNPYIRDKKDR